MSVKRRSIIAAALLGAIPPLGAADAQQASSPGVTATEIKIGNTVPYSGPASRLRRRSDAPRPPTSR